MGKFESMVYQSEDRISDPGATVYSNTIFLDIARGTDFEEDARMKNYLDQLSKTFVDLIETEHGTSVLGSLEGSVKLIKDKESFVTAIQYASQLVQKLDIGPKERFSLFLGCIGIIIALVSHPGPATKISNELENVISKTYTLILCTALIPFWNGTQNALENFFSCKFLNALSDE